ncbi:hypothetical protein MSG37_07220 [Shewanella sp. 1CM18E]|uniref:hypothetical protein n=1 Tax=Shewanella sp. 1CM18E TaxID=2929169 RepID=UPI0020BD92E8|nr:hypothetical protein [Shewanella sp. 1CM18E]MCK8044670.1 hypothetical protein [Shewanella sp. 1CM18E]
MSTQATQYKVSVSYNFVKIFKNLDSTKPPFRYPSEQPDAIKVVTFISEYLANGWDGSLNGKNIHSENVPTDDPNWLKKVEYAQKHDLYHYHIGIPYYEISDDYSTSEYVIHYKKIDNYHIKLVDLDYHNPMTLPKERYLEGEVDLFSNY